MSIMQNNLNIIFSSCPCNELSSVSKTIYTINSVCIYTAK